MQNMFSLIGESKVARRLIKGAEFISETLKKCNNFLKFLEKKGKAPNNNKVHERIYSLQTVSEMVGKSRPTIYKAEEAGFISAELNPKNGKKIGYKLEQINKLREHFGSSRKRRANDPCLKVAIQSFKGGVAKSVTSVHLAQYLGQAGYRVLLADFDPQASATSAFGFLPDHAFSEDDTMLPYIKGKKKTLHYAIIPTYFSNVSLMPSCLPFYDAEFHLAFAAAGAKNDLERVGYFTEFVDAFKTVEDAYDVIIFDSPPALGMITINILAAADGLIIPTPPAFSDFSSTVQYFTMIEKVVKNITPNKTYNFVKVLATRVDNQKSVHKKFYAYMSEIFGENLMEAKLEQAAIIMDLATDFKTIYDVNPTKKHERILRVMNAVCGEIEKEILKWWPSCSDDFVVETVEELENVEK